MLLLAHARAPARPGAEAIVRGYKQGLLTAADYNNLCQCESLDDIKLYLVREGCWRAAHLCVC